MHRHRRFGSHIPRKSGGRTIDAPGLVDEFRARELSRRDLLQGAITGSAVFLGGSLIGCGSDRDGRGAGTDAGGPGDAGGGTDSGPADAGVDAAPRPLHLVGMGYSETSGIEAMDAALAETIGLSFIAPGDTVYFKVNCNNGDDYPHSTSPDVIVELAQRCRDAGASRIIVGDRSFWGDPRTLTNMRSNGVAQAAEDAGAELMVFDDAAVDWVAIPETDSPTWVGGFRLPVPVMEANHIINLPLVKTHFISTFTMALKNFLGVVNPVDRAREGNLDVHITSRLWRQIAEVNQHLTPSLNVLDGWRALITGGPGMTEGAGASYADPRVVVVSTDRIATDVTGIAILQTFSPPSEDVTRSTPWSNLQISTAVGHDLGITGPGMYDLSGPTVPTIEDYRALAVRS